MFWKKPTPPKPNAAAARQRFVEKLDALIGDYRRDVGDFRIAEDLERRVVGLRMADAMRGR